MQEVDLIDNTELETEEIASEMDSEIDSEMDFEVSDQTQPEVNVDVEAAVYAALDSYFSENTVLVSEVGHAEGINKPIADFSLTEVCLVLILMILLGGSIFKLIGGRVWNKL